MAHFGLRNRPSGRLRNLMVDTNEVLMDNNSSIPKLVGQSLMQYWLAYNVFVVELCVDQSQTVGYSYVNYKGYTVVSKFFTTNGRRGAC